VYYYVRFVQAFTAELINCKSHHHRHHHHHHQIVLSSVAVSHKNNKSPITDDECFYPNDDDMTVSDETMPRAAARKFQQKTNSIRRFDQSNFAVL